MIKNILPNKSGNLESLINHSSWLKAFSSCFNYSFKWLLKRHCIAKNLLTTSKTFLYETNFNYTSYTFSYQSAFIPILSLRRNRKQESNFQKLSGLVTKTISVLTYSESRRDSKDFYKGIFSHAFPVSISYMLLQDSLIA